MTRPLRKIRILCAAALASILLLAACAGNDPAPGSSSGGGAAGPSGNESSGGAASESTAAGSSESGSSAQGAVSTEIVLATLNIKHGAEGLDTVAEAIREISPDIIGLEEVDVHCERSGYADEPAELAELAGFPYYAFAKAIPLGDGEYGTAILSRYPIESFEVIPLYSGDGEDRSLGHAVIFKEGIKLDVFVTHLSFEDRQVRIAQMKTIAGILKGCGRYILLGDLNSFNIEDINYLDAAYYVNRADRSYGTFRRFGSSPDNIVVSEGFAELSSGVSDRECSDHKLLYASFRLDGE